MGISVVAEALDLRRCELLITIKLTALILLADLCPPVVLGVTWEYAVGRPSGITDAIRG